MRSWSEFLKLMKKKRDEKRITQQNLAQAVSIGQSFLAQIEAGDKIPSIDVVKQIAVELNINNKDACNAAIDAQISKIVQKSSSATTVDIHKTYPPKKTPKQKK